MEAQQARVQLVQKVRDDISEVLSTSWELQQVLKTAPTASPAAIMRLSRPTKPWQQQAGGGCEFAKQKTTQLSKQRHTRVLHECEEEQYAAAKQEALQGWYRAKEQEGQQFAAQYQRQLMQQQEAARQTAVQVTRRAKADLQALRARQEEERQQAALAHQQHAQWQR